MDDDVEYAGRLLAGRYRLPHVADDFAEPAGTPAYDTASGQEVLARRVLLPEVVEAEFLDDAPPGRAGANGGSAGATRRPSDPAVRRAVEAALAASRIPDHPRLDQVFDAFVEGDALWVISELLPARPLSELIAARPLAAHRAAEIAADVLAALRTVHAHGWVHRNVTARTVLVCDDGRAVLTGLAAGAAEEALCGHDPLPDPSRTTAEPRGGIPPAAQPGRPAPADAAALARAVPGLPSAAQSPLPAGFHRDAPHALAAQHPHQHQEQGQEQEQHQRGSLPATFTGPEAPGTAETGDGTADAVPVPGREGIFGFEGADSGGGPAARAARRGAIAAYRAGAQAATARVAAEAQQRGGADWWTKDSGPPADDPGSGPHDPYAPYGPHGSPYAPADRVPEAHGTDPHGPAALPGPRRIPGRSVPTPWAPEQRDPVPDAPGDEEAAAGTEHAERHRGPTTSLAAERARQARMAMVGATTERWAPEQAGPVHENWRLAPPVGPSADLWALGVLLFRAVQGHAPYPEDDVAELVQMVCAEPPAFAEECGPLRPVVESLMRQDPTERPDFEVLRGWLRSLIRSAPEPDVGRYTLTAPPSLEPGRPSDPRRLPVKRRRGELVRRRRTGRGPRGGARRTQRHAPAAPRPAPRRERAARPEPAPRQPQEPRPPRPARAPGAGGTGRSPKSLGRLLLGGVLLLLTAAVLYAMWFMPRQDTVDDGSRRSSLEQPEAPPASGGPAPEETAGQQDDEREPSGETAPQTSEPAAPADGFRLHEDPTGFRIAVPEGWDRNAPNGRGQVRFDSGEFEMVVVKGRDSTEKFGSDPMAYQSDGERELEPFRTSDWSSASGLRRIDVGDTAMAEGTYTWQDASGRDVYVRNRAMILDGRYHLVLVIGPDDERDAVDRWFGGAADTYRVLR